MRVLFFSSEFPGPHDPHLAVFNLRMCEALSERHDVRVVAPVAWTGRLRRFRRGRSGAISASVPAEYPTHYFVPRLLAHLRGRFMWHSVAPTLKTVTRAWRPDVVLAYWTFPDGEVAVRLGRRLRVPVVQMVGGSDVLLSRRTGRRWTRTRRVLRTVDQVVTVGQDLARRVVEAGADVDRVTSVYRPVQREVFSPGSRPEARAHLGLPVDRPLVLWVGRFVPVKGLRTLIAALARVRQACPHVLVCLIGEGPELAHAIAGVRDLGLTDHVRFVGVVGQSELPHWYRAADVVVLPSLSEGVPNVLLESISCGTPFVASSVGGVPEIAEPDLDSLVPPGRPDALALALTDHLTRPRPSRLRRFEPATTQQFVAAIEDVLERAVTSRATEVREA